MIQWDIQCHDSLPSTQDHLKSLISSNNAPEGLCVQALQQTEGQGRHGRVWSSPQGNLYLSFVLKPECDAAQIGELALLTSVAIAQAIQGSAAQCDVMLKWPNDVLVSHGDSAFKKCAGILVEAIPDQRAVIIGAGINTQNAPDEGAALSADTSTFRDAFLGSFATLYEDWRANGFDQGQELWLFYAHKIGAPISVKIGTDIRRGTFAGLGDHGTLLLRGADGTITPVTSGDVYVTGN